METWIEIIIIGLLVVVQNSHQKEQLHVGAFLTNIEEDVYCFKSAMEAAMQLINDDETLLPNHELVLHFIDNFGTAGFGITQFYKLKDRKPVLQVLLGPFIEQDAIPIRQLTSSLKLPQFEMTDETQKNRRKALLKIFKHFQWNDIALLYDYGYFNLVENAERLNQDMKAFGLNTTAYQGFSSAPSSNAYNQLRNLKKHDTRIITLDMDEYAVPMIFCDAYLNNLTGPKHVFVSSNIGVNDDFWHLKYSDSRCTAEQIGHAADGFISLARSNFRLDGKISRSGKSKEEIWNLIKKYKERNLLNFYAQNGEMNPVFKEKDFYKGSTRMFDLVYRVAVAFDNMLRQKESKDVLMKSYHDKVKYEAINKALNNAAFEGVTGYHHPFDDTGSGNQQDYIVKQYRNGKFQAIGHYTSFNESLVIYNDGVVFPGKIPGDKMDVRKRVRSYKPLLVHTMWSISVLGILLASTFFYINNRYRHKRVVKMSSPNINNTIIVGCILCYLSIIFYGMDTRYLPTSGIGKTCNVITIMISTGFTLSFGALFSKTWRVYRIFSAARQNRKVALRDYYLYAIIALLLLIDVTILTLFLFFSPFELQQSQLDATLDVNNDVLKISIYNHCNCKHRTHFVSAIICYKVILMVFGLFMAWETRNVNIPVLNDAKQIGIAVYTVAVISTIGTICASALNSSMRFEETYFVVSLSVCLCTSITLVLVFLPKARLLFDKDAEKRRRSISASSVSSSTGFHPMVHNSTSHHHHISLNNGASLRGASAV